MLGRALPTYQHIMHGVARRHAGLLHGSSINRMLALQAPLGGTAGEPAPARPAASGGAAIGTAGNARDDEEEQTVAGYWRAHGYLTHVRRSTTLVAYYGPSGTVNPKTSGHACCSICWGYIIHAEDIDNLSKISE